MMDLAELVRPAHTALVTSECQKGVLGPDAVFPELASVAQDMVVNVGRLARAARSAGVAVVHCVADRREDGRGSNTNARLFGAAQAKPLTSVVVDEIGVAEEDIVLSRLHGVGPMGRTDLDPVLRNLGVRTIVVTGVSVNVAVTNLVMDAVNAGYRVVLPRDAVAGVPPSYADAVIDNTLKLLATVCSSTDVVGAWKG